MDQFTNLYETMLGLLEPEAQVPGVDNAFEDGALCAVAYEDMRSAYERLCQRLNCGEEDPDLNIMVEKLETIQKELCRRIFIRTQRP